MSGRRAVGLALVLAAGGCEDREIVGTVPVKSAVVTAAGGGLITVTADDDPVLAGVYLRIPPGSLPRDVTVTIERGVGDIADPATTPFGPMVVVGPAGTPLSVPARLVLPAGQGTASDRLFIEVRDPDGRGSRLPASSTGTASPGAASPGVQADIDRFAAFQAARWRPGQPVPDGGLPPPPGP